MLQLLSALFSPDGLQSGANTLAMRSFFKMGLLVVLIAATGRAFCQEVTATIHGQVTDAGGAVLPGAKVTVTNADKNMLVRTVITDKSGEFIATLLPIGNYTVRVRHAGFKVMDRTGIELHVGDSITLTLAMQVGEVSQEVTVNADATQVQLQSSASEQLISGNEIRELSIANRNFLALIALLPGVTNTSASDEITIGAVNPTGGVNVLPYSLNGGRTNSNSYLLDGADNLDRGANQTLINTPSVDAVAEFKVERGAYSAEYGRNASGQVNIVTRSGNSQFHGDIYEFFRNDVMAANNSFNKYRGIPRQELRYNDFGYTLGGPLFIPNHYNVERNKTFFFFSEEFRRIILYNTQSGYAPTDAMKGGTFVDAVCVTYPCTTANATHQINTTAFDPVAAAYLLVSTGRNVFNTRQEFIRVDENLSQRNSITGRYILDTINTVEPYGYQVNSLLPGTSTTSTQHPGANAMVRLTTVVRPTLLNEIAFAFTTSHLESTPIGTLSKANATDVHVNLPFQSTLGNVPYIAMTSLSPIRGFGAYSNYSRNYNLFDNVTQVLGRHTFKYGATYNYYQKSENNASTNAGSFTFNTTGTPSGCGGTNPCPSNAEQTFANFLLGQQATFAQTSLDLTPDIRQNEVEFYFQDDYRWLPTLTINAGVRYSLYRLPIDDRQMLSNFDPATYVAANAPTLTSNGANVVPGTGDPLNGIIVNGATSPYGNAVSNQPGGHFAPRVGFAWDPFGNGKTALRGGYGIVYDSTLVGIYENNIFTNRPYLNNLSVNNTTFANPSGGSTTTSLPSLRATPIPSHLPYTQVWSLDAQRQFGKSTMLDVGYYGAKSTHLLGIVDINTLRPGTLTTQNAPLPLTTSNTPQYVNAIRPYVGYTAINSVENWFGSNYNSLQVFLQEALPHSSRLTVAYTLQKTLTDAGSDRANAPQNGYDIHSEYAVAPFNRKQVLVVSYLYRVPFLLKRHGVVGDTLHGWSLAGTANFDTGLSTQVTTSAGKDWAGMGVLGSGSLVALRPNMVSNPNISAPHTFAKWFNTAAYVDPAAGQLGNARSTSLIGPGFQQWDISVFRAFHPGKNWSGEFRAESFNAFNRDNVASVNTQGTSADNAAFGQVTLTRDPRRIQLGLKLSF